MSNTKKRRRTKKDIENERNLLMTKTINLNIKFENITIQENKNNENKEKEKILEKLKRTLLNYYFSPVNPDSHLIQNTNIKGNNIRKVQKKNKNISKFQTTKEIKNLKKEYIEKGYYSPVKSFESFKNFIFDQEIHPILNFAKKKF